MNVKKSLLSRISSALISNLISFSVSTMIVLIVPKFISVEQYGYFQLYLFYIGYIGFANFGLPEGILLNYGGQCYEDLNFPNLKRQYGLFFTLSLILAGWIILTAIVSGCTDKLWLWIGIAGSILVTLPFNYLQVLLHMTNRIHEYAQGILIEKIVYFVAVGVALYFRIQSYAWLIGAELLGRLALLGYASYQNRTLLCAKSASISETLPELRENITSGIKLMLSNLVGLFLIGIIRQCIEIHWSVEVFAKVSLTLSISNMLMIFIRAVSVVLFPMLKTTAYDKLQSMYGKLRLGTMVVLLGMLVLYFPIRKILALWLPNYGESIQYVALLFPICIYECRMSMLIETYMKALRMEKHMLRINIFCVILSMILAVISVFVMNNLELALLSIVVVVAARCMLAETELLKKMQQRVGWDMLFEALLVVCFMAFNWVIGGFLGWGLYLAAYVAYIAVKRSDIVEILRSCLK